MAIRVYRATSNFPKSETYGLRAQVRRAAVSIPTNIVEGCSRHSTREYVRFLEVAFGSSREVNYLIDLALRLEMIDAKSAEELIVSGGKVSATLAALIAALRAMK